MLLPNGVAPPEEGIPGIPETPAIGTGGREDMFMFIPPGIELGSLSDPIEPKEGCPDIGFDIIERWYDVKVLELLPGWLAARLAMLEVGRLESPAVPAPIPDIPDIPPVVGALNGVAEEGIPCGTGTIGFGIPVEVKPLEVLPGMLASPAIAGGIPVIVGIPVGAPGIPNELGLGMVEDGGSPMVGCIGTDPRGGLNVGGDGAAVPGYPNEETTDVVLGLALEANEGGPNGDAEGTAADPNGEAEGAAGGAAGIGKNGVLTGGNADPPAGGGMPLGILPKAPGPEGIAGGIGCPNAPGPSDPVEPRPVDPSAPVAPNEEGSGAGPTGFVESGGIGGGAEDPGNGGGAASAPAAGGAGGLAEPVGTKVLCGPAAGVGIKGGGNAPPATGFVAAGGIGGGGP